jgi:G3E family GTPase
MLPAPATGLTLVSGGRASTREDYIHGAVVPGAAVIIEGLADASSALAEVDPAAVTVVRIAPGCLCCTGNLVLRVTLNRLLRRAPAHIFISMADASHVGQLKDWLTSASYQPLLALAPDVVLAPA